MIQVKGAKKWIQNGARRVEILQGISLDIPAGQFVAIVGASGSGKSTLLGLLAGLDTPSEGEIWLDGVPIHNLAEAQLAAVRGRKIGFVFQSYQLIQTLTALENVLLPYELNVEGSGLEQARRLLDEVGLDRARWITIPCSSPAASSSAWRWRAPLLSSRRWSWPTSPPATSTQQMDDWCSICCSSAIARPEPRWCWSRTILKWPAAPTGRSC